MIEENTIQHLELPSKIESISEIENFIDNLCEQRAIGEDEYGNILIALTEAINNAITHGNQFDANKKVNLEMESTHNQICFTVSDEGNGFDFNQIPDPTLPENITKTNGRGVFLMKSLADEVLFEENGSKTTLKFTVSAN